MSACSIRKGLPGGVPLFRAIWRIVGPDGQKYEGEEEEEVVQEDENAVESDEADTGRGTKRARESFLVCHLRLTPFRSLCLGAVNIVRSA